MSKQDKHVCQTGGDQSMPDPQPVARMQMVYVDDFNNFINFSFIYSQTCLPADLKMSPCLLFVKRNQIDIISCW